MIRRVRLSPTASVTAAGEGVILRSDLGTLQIGGPDAGAVLARIVPLLDGTRDREAVAAALPGYAQGSVLAFLRLLEDHRLVEEVPEAEARAGGQEAFLRAWPEAPRDAADRIGRARVIVVGRGPWGADAAAALRASGVGEVRATEEAGEATLGEPWTLLVAAVPQGDADQAERIARLAHRAKIVSLWSHVAGARTVLGPVVKPGETACRVCATVEGLNPRLGEAAAPRAPWEAAARRLLGHLVAMEALRVISGYTPSDLFGRVLVEDLATMATSLHTLVRLPWCRVCGG